jgi:hypothetical protein
MERGFLEGGPGLQRRSAGSAAQLAVRRRAPAEASGGQRKGRGRMGLGAGQRARPGALGPFFMVPAPCFFEGRGERAWRQPPRLDDRFIPTMPPHAPQTLPTLLSVHIFYPSFISSYPRAPGPRPQVGEPRLACLPSSASVGAPTVMVRHDGYFRCVVPYATASLTQTSLRLRLLPAEFREERAVGFRAAGFWAATWRATRWPGLVWIRDPGGQGAYGALKPESTERGVRSSELEAVPLQYTEGPKGGSPRPSSPVGALP